MFRLKKGGVISHFILGEKRLFYDKRLFWYSKRYGYNDTVPTDSIYKSFQEKLHDTQPAAAAATHIIVTMTLKQCQ